MTPTREEWRPVVGYEGLYEVSDQGRVRGLDRRVGPPGRQRSITGRVLKAVVGPRGYPFVGLSDRDGRKANRTVHSLVLLAFVSPRPPGMEACHGNGDRTDNRLSNLRWDTHLANSQDQRRHGTHAARRRTHCPRGHELALANLCRSLFNRGYRSCLACHRAAAAEQHAKARGEAFDFKAAADAHYERITRICLWMKEPNDARTTANRD